MDELDMANDFVKLRGLAWMEEAGATSQATTRFYLRTVELLSYDGSYWVTTWFLF
jgi:hypothetical protein